MYVCVCNALTEKHVRQAIRSGCLQHTSDVYDCCGAKPQCGKCKDSIADLIDQELDCAPT